MKEFLNKLSTLDWLVTLYVIFILWGGLNYSKSFLYFKKWKKKS